MRKIVIGLFILPLLALGNWDVVWDGSDIHQDSAVFSGQDILVSGSGFTTFRGDLTLNNCYIRVDGFLDCRSDITLNNSIIEVYGSFDIAGGAVITETGASSIMITGNSSREGKVNFAGNPRDMVSVYSDYVQEDSDFLIIDPNSSPHSVVKNIAFYGGFCNIWVKNKRLLSPISNCHFYGAQYGIWQDGVNELTDIRHCLFVDNLDTSITLAVEPTIAQTAEVAVDNVVVDNLGVQDAFGLVVFGSANSSKYGLVRFTNSILTNSYCGWYFQPNSYIAPIFKNIAYYNNGFDDNLADSSFQQNPYNLTQSPFEVAENPGDWQYFLDPQSPIADIELDYNLLQECPELLQTSLFSEPMPRNKGIGVGAPLPYEYSTKVEDLPQDLNLDGIVNNLDYAIFAGFWGAYEQSVDFNDSNSIDTGDLVYFCDNWLSDGSAGLNVAEDAQALTVTCQDPNGLSDATFAFFLNGEYITARDADNPELVIYKPNYPNGEYELFAIVIGDNDAGEQVHIKTQSYKSVFNNELSDFKVASTFDKAKGLAISGKVAAGSKVQVKVVAGEQDIWWDVFLDDFSVYIDPNDIAANSAGYEVAYLCAADSGTLPRNDYFGQVSTLALEGKPDYSTAGLIVAMDANAMTDAQGLQYVGSARYAERMMRQKGICTILLRGFGCDGEVTCNTLKKVIYKYPKINYAHIYANGDYRLPSQIYGQLTQRTGLKINDGVIPAYNSRYWSDTESNVPAGYQWLSNRYEKSYTLSHLPFNSGQLKILALQSCFGLRNTATRASDGVIDYIQGAYEDELGWKLPYHPDYPFTDVCFALKMNGYDQVAVGSGGDVVAAYVEELYKSFFNGFWDKLSRNGNVSDSISEGLDAADYNSQVMSNHRIRGVGIITNMYLTTNP